MPLFFTKKVKDTYVMVQFSASKSFHDYWPPSSSWRKRNKSIVNSDSFDLE